MGGTKVSGLIDRDLWSVALIRCLSAVLLELAFSSATAWAETREQRFQRIDQNGDGVISYEEHAAADEAEFAKIDANGDGMLPVQEYADWLTKENPAAKPVSLSIARCFYKVVDANGDAKVSREEWRSYNDRIFKWLAGDDGRMTLDESKRTPPPEIIPRPVCH